MFGDIVLKIVRLIRQGFGWLTEQVSSLMGTLTPAERPRARRSVNTILALPALAAQAPPSQMIAETFTAAGWDWRAENGSPTGEQSGWSRGRLRIDIPGEAPRWRTIKIAFDPTETWAEFWARVQVVIAGWNAKYPDSVITLDMDDFLFF